MSERLYRRKLPHLRMPGATYFLTWRLAAAQRPLDSRERSCVCSAVCFFHRIRYELLAYVVMDDHAHAVLRPDFGFALEKIVQSLKSFTAHRLAEGSARPVPVWQDEAHDHIIRSEEELAETLAYVVGNP